MKDWKVSDCPAPLIAAANSYLPTSRQFPKDYIRSHGRARPVARREIANSNRGTGWPSSKPVALCALQNPPAPLSWDDLSATPAARQAQETIAASSPRFVLDHYRP